MQSAQKYSAQPCGLRQLHLVSSPESSLSLFDYLICSSTPVKPQLKVDLTPPRSHSKDDGPKLEEKVEIKREEGNQLVLNGQTGHQSQSIEKSNEDEFELKPRNRYRKKIYKKNKKGQQQFQYKVVRKHLKTQKDSVSRLQGKTKVQQKMIFKTAVMVPLWRLDDMKQVISSEVF